MSTSTPAAAPVAPKKSGSRMMHEAVLYATSGALIIGGLTCGFDAAGKGDMIGKVLRRSPKGARIVKGLIGASAVYVLAGIMYHAYEKKRAASKSA